MMASSFGRQASMNAELHKRKVETSATAATKTSRRGVASSSKRGVTASSLANKDRVKTSYSRRSRTAAPSVRSRKTNGGVPSNIMPPPLLNGAGANNIMSQMSELTDRSTMTSSQNQHVMPWNNQCSSQGLQSQRSSRSLSQGGGSMQQIPLGQPSLASGTSHAATSVGHSQFSQRSTGRFGMSLGASKFDIGKPLQRRDGTVTSNRSVPFAPAAAAPRTTPPQVETAQRLMKDLMSPVAPSFAAPRQSLVSQAFLRSSASQASTAAPFHTTASVQPSLLFGQTNAVGASQESKQMADIKALVKDFEKLVEEKSRNMNAQETKTLAKMDEKVRMGLDTVDEKMASGLDAMDSKLKAVNGKAESFAKAARAAERSHEARIRFFADKSQELDGKVAEVASVIATERESSIKEIKKTANSFIKKLEEVGLDVANRLHNLPVPEMIKKVWTDLCKAKDSRHKVESTPQAFITRECHRTPSSSSAKTTQTVMSHASKKKVRVSSSKTSQSKRDCRSILSPLQIVENPSRKTLKRRSDVLDSPSSKVSVVTPSNLSRSSKRTKGSSSAVPVATSKRGRTKKSRSSAFSSRNVLPDDFGFLS